MNNSPQIYHGEWWVPAMSDNDIHMFFQKPEQMMGHEIKYTGTLTYYEDKDSILELYHVPSNFHSKHYCKNDVIWGRDANGNIFTLFNVLMHEMHMGNFSCTKFVVEYILIGEHVLSAYDNCFESCLVKFPYLTNWAFQDKLIYSKTETSMSFNIPIIAEKILEALHKEGIYWRIWQGQTTNMGIHDLTITQKSTLEIEVKEGLSIQSYMRNIEEFAQFLSIALYCDQNSSEIKFVNKENKRECTLLFKKHASVDPKVFTLIKFDVFKEKLPIMLSAWHEKFEKIAPISSYLIDSLQRKNSFDVPDFLIIAQALDGYYKRFVNRKDGKDHQKYEDGIKILIHQAVEGIDLYWLTEKCKILLTCCILNMLGLTNEEINICCNNSPISQIINSFPLESD